MDGRERRNASSSPERSRRRPKSQQEQEQKLQNHHRPKQQQRQMRFHEGMKVPVVYYLCRNRHLEHPHILEVPISSHEGLHLRDVIGRLSVLRGKGFAAMYSWSCKRSYKSGFVWHDLSEDDLVLPATANEYVLKASELLDTSPPDRSICKNPKLLSLNQKQNCYRKEPTLSSRSHDSSPSSSINVASEANPSPRGTILPCQGDELSPRIHGPSSSSDDSPGSKRNSPQGSGGSSGLAEYRVYKPIGAIDASTQTDQKSKSERRARGRETRIVGVSTDEGSCELNDNRINRLSRLDGSEIIRGDISPPPASSSTSSSGRKSETLESLIRGDTPKTNSFRILEEEELFTPMGPKLKATNVLMQLITCGSISVNDRHKFGVVPTYKARFSHLGFPSPLYAGPSALGEFDFHANNSSLMGSTLEEKEYFSGSLIETAKLKEEGSTVPTLKRSSSYNAERCCKSPDQEEKFVPADSTRSKCLPRTIKMSCKKNETARSPTSDGARISSEGRGCTSKGSSKRFTDASSSKGSSMRVESFRENKEKIIKIEERLTSGARVIIKSRAPCDDSEGSTSS